MADPNTKFYIYGRNPLREALQTQAEQIEKIFIRNSLRDSKVANIFDLASQNRIPISHVPGPKLQELVGSVNDQGVDTLKSAATYKDLGNSLVKLTSSYYHT